MNETSIFSQSWRYVREHKSLWGLGFLNSTAAVLGVIAIYAGLTAALMASPGLLARYLRLPDLNLAYWPFPSWVIWVALFTLIVWFLLWLVGLAARGGLITAADDIEEGRRPSGGESFGRGWRRAPVLALMSLIVFLPVIALYAVGQVALWLALPDFTQVTSENFLSGFTTLYSISMCLTCGLYFLLIFLQFIHAFAYRGVMLRELGVWSSISHGWRVLRDKPGEIIPLAMIFGGLMVAFYGIAYAVFIAFYLAGLFSFLFSTSAEGPPVVALFFIGIIFLLAMAALFFVMVVLGAWRSTAFTIGYRRWSAPAAPSPIPVAPNADPPDLNINTP